MRGALSLLLLLAVPALAQPDPLHAGSAIVTGTDLRQRPEGFARCLRQVLVKVSGDPSLATDPRVDVLAARAESLLEDFNYRDRMGHLPTQDEQGSRDRPYVLTCRFAPDRIAAALAELGARPWTGPRPRLLARVTMTDRRGATIALTADGVLGDGPRAALLDAAEQAGLRVTLPTEDGAVPPGLVPIIGTIRWSAADFGWVAEWSLDHGGRTHRWRIAGVSFDAAFRNAMTGALAVLSGHEGTAPRN